MKCLYRSEVQALTKDCRRSIPEVLCRRLQHCGIIFTDEAVNFEGLETGLKELFKTSTADLLIFASASR